MTTGTAAGAEDAPAALRIRALDKTFPGVHALQRVDLDVAAGEVHGLVGENGAGKSTLIKMVTGALTPDAGTIEVFGRRLDFGDPRAQQRAGIAAIYQELLIAPERSAAANVFLGQLPRWGPFFSPRSIARRFRTLADELGVQIPPNARAGSMSIANQQMLEIMRALVGDRRILIMDEPTAALGLAERDRLYETVRRLRDRGVAVVFISHDLDEVLSLCDRVSVIRDGLLVASREASEWSKKTLVDSMLGKAIPSPLPYTRAIATSEVLRVEGVRVSGMVNGVSLTIHRGEILGIAGLVGSGRTELLRVIAGADRPSHGRIFVHGEERSWPSTVRRAMALGIALAPEDRKTQGLVLGLSAALNVALSDLGRAARQGWLRPAAVVRDAQQTMSELSFDTRRLGEPAASFSGGNQQKLVVGKWLRRGPKLLLLDEFTRGIDVGAKAEMMSVITRLADEGMAIIVVSSEFEEVVNLADRVLVLARGQIVGELGRSEASVERVLRLIFAVEGQAA